MNSTRNSFYRSNGSGNFPKLTQAATTILPITLEAFGPTQNLSERSKASIGPPTSQITAATETRQHQSPNLLIIMEMVQEGTAISCKPPYSNSKELEMEA